jgi:PKD repeat protein
VATLVQSTNAVVLSDLSGSVILDDAPTPGNLLVVAVLSRGGAANMPTGFTQSGATGASPYLALGYRVVQSGDTDTFAVAGSDFTRHYFLMEWSGAAPPDDVITAVLPAYTYPTSAGGITANPAGTDLNITLFGVYTDIEGRELHVDDPSTTLVYEDWTQPTGTFGPYGSLGYIDGGTATATANNNAFQPAGYVSGNFPGTVAAPTSDFTGTPLTGLVPLTVQFTDQSTSSPTSWSWNFGDGSGAGTAQHPSHEYTAAGTYTVSLVATNASGSGTATKVAYVTPYEPVPGVGVSWDDVTFTDISADLMRWTIRRGAGGLVRDGGYSGSATFLLRNRDNKYNPENTGGELFGLLRDGPRVWVGVNADGTLATDDQTVYGMFAGRITEITPIVVPGAAYPPTVEIVCEDPLSWIARTPVTISESRTRSHKELREAVLAAANETSIDLAYEPETMPLSGANGLAGGILKELNAATGTRHFVRPADIREDFYEIVSVRRTQGLGGVAAGTVDAGADHVTATAGWRKSAETVINQQRVSINPVYFGAATEVVWTAPTLPFTVDSPTEMWVDFDDFVDNPQPSINYTGGTATAVLTSFGRSAKILLDSTSSSVITALHIEGSIAKRALPESYVKDDATGSQDAPRGIRGGTDIRDDYVGTIASARGLAEHVVWRYADPKYRPTLTVENWMPQMFDLDLFDLLAVTSSQIGVTGRIFEIIGVTHTCYRASNNGVHHVVDYELVESRVQSPKDWFTLDVSELDSSHVLAY